MDKPLVLYHADCADGFCAAWIAHRVFGEDAEFIPVQYGQEPPSHIEGRRVYILDFSYKRTVTLEMARKAAMLFILDHHKTAEKELEGISFDGNRQSEETNIFCKFDVTKSGGRLAWEHFFPGKTAPWLVDYTEDRDLRKWELPASPEISTALESYPRTFKRWNMFADFPEQAKTGFAREGGAILRYQEQQIESQCKSGHKNAAGFTE